MERLLFVDDDTELLELNYIYFKEHGYGVWPASNAYEALNLLNDAAFDCIILDIRMEGQDGFELCRKLRERSNAPVIFLTVLTDEDSLAEGFQSGGDDYVAKPYNMKELELRIQARIHPRQHQNHLDDSGEQSRLFIRADEKQAYIGSSSLELTVNEFQILLFLSQRKGTPCRQEEIYEALWGESCNTHSVQVMITRIRRKIKALSPGKEYIRTQWGKGYIYME